MEVLSPLSYDEKKWAMFCHLSSLAGVVLPIPFANIIAPLIIWTIKKESSEFIDDQGKQVINFQISMLIYTIILIPFAILLIGIPALIAIAILDLIFTIIGAVKANNGERYRYPMAITFLK